MNRLEWFRKYYCPNKIFDIYETESYTEIMADRDGETSKYKVYGKSEEDYELEVEQ